ncbi:pyridoxamine 5'-phosphate oxidase family protein [Asanoa siamensis]|uniref:Pyridoxamine 5'-phosphate oxidase n=1 Tax=Asanoa siamensis TaxID=926357 RepID=A0ABQ4CQR2_9ACTN|nr:pyridoxamine 5'-phosphate oxidase family protein [Asanoa siamensis]GIF73192.1 pyridoxamine 5'-phosphate oxidase [Asanoa siamensis]
MKLHEKIDGRLREFIEAQHMFFVATAPSGDGGHVNLSPKGMGGTFAVLGEHRVAYLDFHGSGAETLAHLRQNGRITIMFCAFQGPPNIVRLHGRGTHTPIGHPDLEALLSDFPDAPDLGGLRGVITVEVSRVSDSCGYAVPLMSYDGDRDLPLRWAARKDEAALADYRRNKNAASIDGLQAFDEPVASIPE